MENDGLTPVQQPPIGRRPASAPTLRRTLGRRERRRPSPNFKVGDFEIFRPVEDNDVLLLLTLPLLLLVVVATRLTVVGQQQNLIQR